MLKRLMITMTLTCIGMSAPQFADDSNSQTCQREMGSQSGHDQQYQYDSRQKMQQPVQNQSQIQWHTNYNQALQAAQKQNKPILLFFTGSDWCGWCKKMDQEIFNTPEFVQDAGNNFVFVEVDFPMNRQLSQDLSQQNASLKQRYGVTGYPTIVILDSSGNFIAETGYRPGGGKAYADYLRQLVQ